MIELQHISSVGVYYRKDASLYGRGLADTVRLTFSKRESAVEFRQHLTPILQTLVNVPFAMSSIVAGDDDYYVQLQLSRKQCDSTLRVDFILDILYEAFNLPNTIKVVCPYKYHKYPTPPLVTVTIDYSDSLLLRESLENYLKHKVFLELITLQKSNLSGIFSQLIDAEVRVERKVPAKGESYLLVHYKDKLDLKALKLELYSRAVALELDTSYEFADGSTDENSRVQILRSIGKRTFNDLIENLAQIASVDPKANLSNSYQ